MFIACVCVTCLYVRADSNTTAITTATSSSCTSDGMGYNGMSISAAATTTHINNNNNNNINNDDDNNTYVCMYACMYECMN